MPSSRPTRRPAACSASFPFFQRLLSWTKPHAQAGPRLDGVRALRLEQPGGLRAGAPRHHAAAHGWLVRVPVTGGDGGRASAASRSAPACACATRPPGRAPAATARDYVLHTPAGDYRSRVVIFAVGVAEPSCPTTPGIEHAAHYVDTREAASYAGKRLFIIGKQNSGFELASGLLQWASPIILASPRPAQLSVNLHSLAGVRARYIQPWEDAELGGGVFILERLHRAHRAHVATGLAVHTRRSDNGEPFVAEVDEVIAATGFRCPLLDLEDVGVSVFGRSRLPIMTNPYESATAPGIYFAGTIGQGVAGLKKYGIPANSGAVHGHRYNARLMVDDLAEHATSASSGPGPTCRRRGRRLACWPRRPRRPSSGTRSRTWPGLSPATRTASCATRASSRWPSSSTRPGRTARPSPWRRTTRATSTRRSMCAAVAESMAMPGWTSSPLLDFRGPEHRAQLAALIDGVLG